MANEVFHNWAVRHFPTIPNMIPLLFSDRFLTWTLPPHPLFWSSFFFPQRLCFLGFPSAYFSESFPYLKAQIKMDLLYKALLFFILYTEEGSSSSKPIHGLCYSFGTYASIFHKLIALYTATSGYKPCGGGQQGRCLMLYWAGRASNTTFQKEQSPHPGYAAPHSRMCHSKLKEASDASQKPQHWTTHHEERGETAATVYIVLCGKLGFLICRISDTCD